MQSMTVEHDSYPEVLEAIRNKGFKVREGANDSRAQCPAHGGQGYNLAVRRGHTRTVFTCHSRGCSYEEILESIGLRNNSYGQVTYNFGGNAQKYRRDNPDGTKTVWWQKDTKPAALPLIQPNGSKPISEADTVYIAEGEKTAQALHFFGFESVASFGSKDDVNTVDLEPLKGKTVYIAPDNDDPGQEAAIKLLERLQTVADRIGFLKSPAGVQDAADVWERGGTVKDFAVHEPMKIGEQPKLDRDVKLVSAAQIKTQKQAWLFDGRIPLGTVTLFAARGGEGKSSYALHVASQLGHGTLAGDLQGRPAATLIISHEDDWATVMIPRLKALEADLDKIYQLNIIQASTVENGEDMEVQAVFPMDISLLEKAVKQSGAKLIIVDPLPNALQGDKYKTADVRQGLDELLRLAQRLQIAVVGIQHFNKGQGHASDKISGSHAFRDAVRSVLLFATDPDTEEKIVTIDKSNYAAVKGNSFKFKLESVNVKTDDGETVSVGKVVELGDTDLSVEELINRVPGGDDQEDRNAAQAFILDYLKNQADQEGLVAEIMKAGRAAGFTDIELKNARSRSRNPRIESRKSSFETGWVWGIKEESAHEEITKKSKKSLSEKVTPSISSVIPSLVVTA